MAEIVALTRQESMNPLRLAAERFVVATQQSNGGLLGFGQLEPKPSAQNKQFLELRTMIVKPEHRQRGVGKALLGELLRRGAATDIFLTTISRQAGFYMRQGFTEVPLGLSTVPGCMLFEVAAGLVVARLAAKDRLVVLKRPRDG
ncbi:hypothetical protein WJX81_001200 [Elliptochloris bilobata]|uniref:N-acetyltransferase domain-containing protein n=1 Tax=Elliptochloris bilobata TaxID=381761 RepID=A0AAW1RF99_9CHLO